MKHQKKRSKSKLIIWSILILIFVTVGVFWAVGHLDSNQPTKPKTVRLTAIGDSLTYGVGDSSGKGGYTNLIRKKVNRSQHNVVMTTSNFGISGETTDQINHRVITSKKLQASIKQADVITVTTGGNDMLHFLKSNIGIQNDKLLSQQLKKYSLVYQKRVTRLLESIRHLNKHVQLFVFGIYNPVYVYFPQVSFISRSIQVNNQITKRVVLGQSNVHFIPIDKKLSDGQYQTAQSRAKLRKQTTVFNHSDMAAGELEKMLGGQSTESNKYLSDEDHFHPNKLGYGIMTNLLYKEMCQYLNWLKE